MVVLKEVSNNITFTPKIEHGSSIKDIYTILVLRIFNFIFYCETNQTIHRKQVHLKCKITLGMNHSLNIKLTN